MRVVVILAVLTHFCDGFTTSIWLNPPSSVSLEAKKGGKKGRKIATTGGGSGFGVGGVKQHDDFAVFPKLEPQVIETLDPSPEDWALEPGSLPREIYDRLEQIYGLKEFNFESEPSLSLNELLSSTKEGSDESNREQTKSSSIDLDSLLASATGGIPSTKVSESSEPVVDLDIGRLPHFKDFRVLHIDPLVLAIDDFFTAEECERYVTMSKGDDVMRSRSPTVGKDASAKAQRTSTTFYHHFENVPELMAKATRLLGLEDINRWEEPQTVRYGRKEKFTWHLDALGPNENKPELGGQRLVTLLVYLTDLDPDEGGATMFRDLGQEGKPLSVRPRKGSALLFFPAAGGIPNTPFDVRTLHCGEAIAKDAKHDKWIAQLWLRQGNYSPTAPAGNSHSKAASAIASFCTQS